MLFRVSGKLSDGTPFSGRYEAPNAMQATGICRKALNDAGKTDDDVAEVRARVAKGGKSINFGKKADPNAPKRERKPKSGTAKK